MGEGVEGEDEIQFLRTVSILLEYALRSAVVVYRRTIYRTIVNVEYLSLNPGRSDADIAQTRGHTVSWA